MNCRRRSPPILFVKSKGVNHGAFYTIGNLILSNQEKFKDKLDPGPWTNIKLEASSGGAPIYWWHIVSTQIKGKLRLLAIGFFCPI